MNTRRRLLFSDTVVFNIKLGSPSSITLTYGSGTTGSTIIVSNKSITLSLTATWFTVTQSQVGLEYTLTIKSNSLNTSAGARLGTITITNSLGTQIKINVSQNSAYVFSTSTNTSRSVDPASGSFSFSVTSTYAGSALSFSISGNSWLTGSQSWSGTSKTVTANYTRNSTGDIRSGTLTLTQTTSNKKIYITVNLDSSLAQIGDGYGYRWEYNDGNYTSTNHDNNSESYLIFNGDYFGDTFNYSISSEANYDKLFVYILPTNYTYSQYCQMSPSQLNTASKGTKILEQSGTYSNQTLSILDSLSGKTILFMYHKDASKNVGTDNTTITPSANFEFYTYDTTVYADYNSNTQGYIYSNKNSSFISFTVDTISENWLRAEVSGNYVYLYPDLNYDSNSRQATVQLIQSESNKLITITLILSEAVVEPDNTSSELDLNYEWQLSDYDYGSPYVTYESIAHRGIDSSEDTMYITVNGQEIIYAKNDSEYNYDYVIVYDSNNNEIGNAQGYSNYWAEIKLPAAGTYRIVYRKDGSNSTGNDCGWVAINNVTSTIHPYVTMTFNSLGIYNMNWEPIQEGRFNTTYGWGQGNNENIGTYHSGSTLDGGSKTIVFRTSDLPYDFLYYEVSSEDRFDFLTFYYADSEPGVSLLDNASSNFTQISRYSGSSSSNYFSIGSKGYVYYGSHPYVIVQYSKDGSASNGSDRAWISIRSELETWGWCLPLGQDYFSYSLDGLGATRLENIKQIPSGTTFKFAVMCAGSKSSSRSANYFWLSPGIIGLQEYCSSFSIKGTNTDFKNFDFDTTSLSNLSYSTDTYEGRQYVVYASAGSTSYNIAVIQGTTNTTVPIANSSRSQGIIFSPLERPNVGRNS